MKKIPILSFIFVFMITSSVQASEWSYHFVVWDGKVYEVQENDIVEESKIGKRIGKVKTEPYSTMRSSAMIYYGNASNYYPIGTPYYEMKGISPSAAIAVKDDNQWIQAKYMSPAPYHVMNTITNPFVILTVVIFVLILFELFYGVKRLIRQFN